MATADTEERTKARGADDSISGRVFWPDGTPAQAWVSAVDEREEKRLPIPSGHGDEQGTSADGGFEITGLEGGPFRIQARRKELSEPPELDENQRKDYGDRAFRCEQEHVEPGTHGLALMLSSGLEVSGSVVDESGTGVDVFKVHAQRAGRTSPMENATNTFSGAFQGAGGAFVLGGFCAGTWVLTLTAEGHVDSEPTLVDVPCASPLEFVLFHTTSVRGIVLDPRGKPIGGATVSEDPQPFPWMQGAHSSVERGEFSLELPPRPVTLFASAPGYAPSEPLVLEPTPGQIQEGLVLQLRNAGTIAGDVLGPGARPQVGLFVSISENEGGSGYDAGDRTDSSGHFVIEGVPPGEYSVRTYTSAGIELSAEVTVREGENAPVCLVAPDYSVVKLHGRVTIGSMASAGTHIEASREGEERSARPASAECDPSETYELVVPGAGRYSVSILTSGGDSLSWSTTIDVPGVPEFPFDIAVPVGRVRGRVTSREGTPLADLPVRTARTTNPVGEWGDTRTHTDNDGRYELLVIAGSVTVVAGGNDWPFDETVTSWTEARATGLTVAVDEELDGIDLALSPGGTLVGRARLADGGPVGRVMIVDSGNNTHRMLTATDEDGNFRIQGLEPGILLVAAYAGRAGSSQPVSVTIEPGMTTELVLELVPEAPQPR